MLLLVWVNFALSAGVWWTEHENARESFGLTSETLTSATAPLSPLARMTQPRDPHTGTQVRIITTASITQAATMINFISHMEHTLPALPLEIYTMDEDTHAICTRVALPERGHSCLYSPQAKGAEHNASQPGGSLQHKMQLIHSLLNQNQTVAVFDTTAFLLQPACFWDLLAPEGSLVASTATLCTEDSTERPPCSFHLGMALWRPAMRPVAKELVNRMRVLNASAACPNEALLHSLMEEGEFRKKGLNMSSKTCTTKGGTGHFEFGGKVVDVVALNSTSWHRDAHVEGACAYHPPMGKGKERRTLMDSDMWYSGNKH